MPAPLPVEVREAIVRARDRALSRVELCELLGLSLSTVTRVLRRRRVVGTVAALPRGGGNFSPIQGNFAELVQKMPDATIAQLTDVLIRDGDQQTSVSAVTRALGRLGYTRKKPFIATERDTPEHRERRRAFCEVLALTNAETFVFIHESFCRTGMRRGYAWSARGLRVHGERPGRNWRRSRSLARFGSVNDRG